MLTFWIEEPPLGDSLVYDGTQLKSLFAYMNYGLLGDSIVAWRGPCHVPLTHMVDGEDARMKAEIRGSDMVHFIVELFSRDLDFAVAFQRIMASLVVDIVSDKAPETYRIGDDIYLADRKLSISIATKSPVSSLIHFAVNVNNEGTPVPTVSLADLGLDPKDFARTLMAKATEEYASIVQATQKVFWVR